MILPGLPFGLTGIGLGVNQSLSISTSSSDFRVGDIAFIKQSVASTTTTPAAIPSALSGWTTLASGTLQSSATSSSGNTVRDNESYRFSWKVIVSGDIGTSDANVVQRIVIRNSLSPSNKLTAISQSGSTQATSSLKAPVSVVLFSASTDQTIAAIPSVNSQAASITYTMDVTTSAQSGGTIESDQRRFRLSFYPGDFSPNTITWPSTTSGSTTRYFFTAYRQ